MRCIVCDRCKKIIDNQRNCRVITCARPLKLPIDNNKVPYSGTDRKQNDIIWEREICIDCVDALEAFFEQEVEPDTSPEPDDPIGDETTEDPGESDESDGEYDE